MGVSTPQPRPGDVDPSSAVFPIAASTAESPPSAGGLPAGLELLGRLPAGVAYLAGPEHVFRFANDLYRRLVGGREVVGRWVRDALPELAGQGYVEMLDRVMRTGEAAEGRAAEVWLVGPDGDREQIFVDFVYQPVSEDGAVLGILVHAADVTAHVRDQQRTAQLTEQLAGSEERHRTLFETMPYGVVHHDADGAIVAANPAATAILGVGEETLVGLSPQDSRWQSVREDGAPLPGEQHPAMVALTTGGVTDATVMGVTDGRTGQRRWLSVIGVPFDRDGSGRPRRAYAMFSDVTEQRRTAAALQERNSFVSRLRDADVLGVLVADEHGVTDANDAFLRMVGRDREDLDAGRIDWRAMTPPEWVPRDEQAVDELRDTGACRPFEKEYLRPDGTRVPILIGAAVIDRDPLRWVTFVADLSERQRAEAERAGLLANAQAARAEAARAEEGLALLLRAGSLAAATRDPDRLLEHSTRLLVPALADIALVLLPTDGRRLRPVAGQHGEDTPAAVLDTLGDQPVPPSDRGFTAPYLTGRSRVLHGLSRAGAASALDPWSAQLARRLGADSVLSVPLGLGAGSRGVLVLGRCSSGHPFSSSDVAVVEELGRRLAVGLANAEAFAREHTVSETLQRALLPETLPAVPGVELAVRYLATTAGVEVGGDWYDVFPLTGTCLGLAIGDVVGHSIAAGATMGQLRTIMRTYAMDATDPAVVLERTNAALTRMLPGSMATALYAVLDTGTGDLTYANAGHPPPLLSGPDGRPRYLTDAPGRMLGATEDTRYDRGHVRLTLDSVLLLYTDGLIEDRHRDIDEGLAELETALTEGPARTAPEACSTALNRLLGSRSRRDDVCLLAVRRVPQR